MVSFLATLKSELITFTIRFHVKNVPLMIKGNRKANVY